MLHKTQRRVGNWIGSSVIHLGDHNVPNALVFIDKYTQVHPQRCLFCTDVDLESDMLLSLGHARQVPTILGPITICLEQLERIYKEDDGIHRLIDKTFGGLKKLKTDILYDFFKSAFDGSGASSHASVTLCTCSAAQSGLGPRLTLLLHLAIQAETTSSTPARASTAG